MKIIKRNGKEVEYDETRIITAIRKANAEVDSRSRMSDKLIEVIAEDVSDEVRNANTILNVEDIQDLVIYRLTKYAPLIAVKYSNYRYKRELSRKANSTDEQILSLIELSNEEAKQENSNKNPVIVSTQRDYMAGEVSKDLTKRILLPKDIIEAHEKGIIHFHDSDYYAQHMHNCCLVNLDDMLQNGTVISGTMIEKPHSFSTACNIATQVIAQVASSQYGGQTITLSHLAPFVQISREKFKNQVLEEYSKLGFILTDEQVQDAVEIRVKEEIKKGVQTIQYQVETLMTTNGQAPFITVFMYLNEVDNEQTKSDLALIIEEVLRQRILGVKNEKGVYITPAFPKLIYVLEEDNIREGSKYWELTKLAAQCTAKRMVPDYISEKVMKELKNGDCYPSMGCRSFLTTSERLNKSKVGNVSKASNYNVDTNKYYGRFNQGVVTINLPYIACLSGGNMDKFYHLLDDYLELCHKALRLRHERLLGTPSDVAPILWQYGALARLEKGETIDKLLYNGYSTISLGYAGIYEMVQRMLGCSHTDDEGKHFALSVMQILNDKCDEWKKAENIDYSVYGTPLESTTYKFAKALKRDFGEIKEVSDHDYVTNSYHICVRENINAFDKLKFESEFQKLSPGGAISYVEVPDMSNNIPAVLSVMQYIYDNIMYAELNTKSDYCQVCGYTGQIQIITDEDGKLIWECPNCKNKDQNKMNVARRTCGYIGTNFWNQGRTQEIKERVLHL